MRLFSCFLAVNCVKILHNRLSLLVIRQLAIVVGLVDALLLQFLNLGLVLFDLLLDAVKFTFAHHLVLRGRFWRNVVRKLMSWAYFYTAFYSHFFPG